MAEWKLVPVEPTREMIDAGHMHTMRADEEEPYRARGEAIACYSDMLSAAPQAPSGQQAEPTELLRAMVGWYSTHGTLHHSDVMGKAKAFLAGQQSERPAPVVREFTNELGNRIKITIEGPTSMSENILTPMEAKELQAALAASQAEPTSVIERQQAYRNGYEQGWHDRACGSQHAFLASQAERPAVKEDGNHA